MRLKNLLAKGTGLVALLALFCVFAGTGLAADMAKLKAEAAQKGTVPVIVGLELPMPFIPEGAMASPQARERQREAIMDSRERFFAMMSARAAGNYVQYAQWDSLPYVAVHANERALEALKNNPLVNSVEEDSLSEPHLASATAHIGADDTWDAGLGGLGRTVVILDTGIDADHPFFGGRVVQEACFSAGAGGTSLCPDGTNSQSGLGAADALTAQCLNGAVNLCDHGSHVAGIAAGRDPGGATATGYDGVAPEARIIAIQVFTRFNNDADCGGNPGDAPCVRTWDSDQLSALNYVNNTLYPHWNITSVNMSLGGGVNTSACDGDSRKAAIDNLRSNDIATVISSGNEDWTDALGAPGCISTAVTVGNVFDGNPCGTFDEVTDNMHEVVDLLASGRCVDSSVPDDAYANKSGTSMAAPEVTGAFAMLKAFDPTMSVDDIENLLKDTGVLVMDTRPPCDFSGNTPPGRVCATSGIVKPRIQLDAAVASLTETDLQVFKDCKPDGPMLIGESATCTITVQNWGPDPALGVFITDAYVSNGIFEFGTITTTAGTCTPTANPQNGSGSVECDLGSLPAGNTITVEIEVTADTPQDINDRVTVTALTPDPDITNNVAEDTVQVREFADLQVWKDCKPDEALLAGETATCFIRVRNWGPSTAENVVLTDTHVSNGVFAFGTITSGCTESNNIVTCALGDMAQGEELQVQVELLPVERMNINDTAVVASDTYDPDIANNSASDGIGVDPVANLALTKSAAPEPVIAGTQLTYDLTVTNNGPSTAVNVVVEDTLPAGVTIDSVNSSGGTCNAGEPGNASLPTTCTFDSLADGASETMQIVVTVESHVLGILGNNARVYSDVHDTDNSDNLATVATNVEGDADLMVTKTDSPDPVLAGAMLTYDLTVMNNGPSTAVDVMVTDSLPAEVAYQGYIVSNGAGTCQFLEGPPNMVECDLNNLDPGEFVTVYLTVLVDPAVPDGTSIWDEAAVEAATSDSNAANNSVMEDTLVRAEADLVITKDASFLTDNPSKQITYNLLVSNSGPSDALNVQVVDMLPLDPKKIVYVTDSGNGACIYDEGLHEVVCDYGTLAAGDSIAIDIVVDARGSVREITNDAAVSSTTTDPDTANNTASKRIRIKGGPGKK